MSTIDPPVQGSFGDILVNQEPMGFLCTETKQPHQIDMMYAAYCLNLYQEFSLSLTSSIQTFYCNPFLTELSLENRPKSSFPNLVSELLGC